MVSGSPAPILPPVAPPALPVEAAPAVPDGAAQSGAVWSRLLRPVWLLLGLLAIGYAAHRLHGAQAGLLPAVAVLQDGVRGRVLFLLAGLLICAVGLPRQTVCFAAGIAYGVIQGIALSLLATVGGAVIGFLWARLAGRDWARRKLDGNRFGLLARLDRRVRERPFATVLLVRLLPVGSALMLNLAAGVLGLRLWPFFWATVLGSLPQTVIFVLLGSGTRIGHGVQVLLAVSLFVASTAIGLLLLRRSSLAAAQRSA